MTYSPSLRGSTPEELNGDSSLPTSTHRLLCLDSDLYTPGAGLRYPLRIRFAFFGFAGMRTLAALSFRSLILRHAFRVAKDPLIVKPNY
ncbi:MAG: hypothetical protein ACK576_04310 [Cyclobacteriaceae bacterium]